MENLNIENDKRFQIIASYIPNAFAYQVLIEPDGKRTFFYVSPYVQEVAGVTPEEVMNNPDLLLDQILPEDMPILERAEESARKELSVFNVKLRVRRADGEIRWANLCSAPRVLEAGKILWDGIYLDVTDQITIQQEIEIRRRAEQALLDSENRFQAAMQYSPIGLAIVSPDGKFLEVNPSLCRMLHLSEGELLATNFQSITHPEDLAKDLTFLDQLIKGDRKSYQMEKRYRDKEGRYFWIQLDVSLVRDTDGRPKYFVSQIQDIQERKRTEQALLDREEHLSQITENVNAVFGMTDFENSKLYYISPAYERIWGRTVKSHYERPNSWLDNIHPEDRERVKNASNRGLRDGTYNETFRVIHPDGSEHWIHDRSFPVRSGDTRDNRVVGMAQDITKQKFLEQELFHAQRLESMGTLAGGIAHDFNNILAIIMSYASLLGEIGSDPEKTRELIDVIVSTSQRGAAIVKQLLTLSKKAELSLQSLSLEGLIQESLVMIRETFPKHIEVISHLETQEVIIRADHIQMHQIFLNLLLNAKDAMPEGGSLSIHTKKVSREEVLSKHPDATANEYARIEISDTGMGIDEETQRRIFDPFFTTKGVGKGTGLGLSLVHGIIQNHKGFLSFESELGEGTTFILFFPIDTDSAQEANTPERSPEKISHPSKKVILIVEDEKHLSEWTAHALSKAGFESILAEDGEVGVELFARNASAIGIVICDLGLPKLSGYHVLEQIRRIDKEVPMILVTGHLDPKLKDSLDKLNLKAILQKPYDWNSMLKILEELDV